MKLTELLLNELESEGEKSRRALEQVPDGKHDWKPHDRSMIFGYLVDMVANIPGWVTMIVNQDELDIAPPGGSQQKREAGRVAARRSWPRSTRRWRARARRSPAPTTRTSRRRGGCSPGGRPVLQMSRHLMIRDTINHWVHHRGQMTVYLRLMGAKVPALYGPSADDQRFE